jgi:DNA (cytosine-5)-methyltransferase 1
MATLKKLNGTKSSGQTLSAAATRASLSVRQENGEVTKTRVTCGLGYDTPLANYDPGTQSWKMCEDIYLWAEPTFLATLPASGMTRNGVLYQQPAWEPITNETESSSWPTPTAVTRPMEGNVRLYRAKIAAGEMTEQEAQVILGKSVWEAQGKVKAMWPTPTTQEVEHPLAELTETGRRKSKDGTTSHSLGLADMVQRWPTPTARDWKGAAGFKEQARNLRDLTYLAQTISGTRNGAAGNGGSLNPTWVEWLMGFPTGWTDLKDLETQ